MSKQNISPEYKKALDEMIGFIIELKLRPSAEQTLRLLIGEAIEQAVNDERKGYNAG